MVSEALGERAFSFQGVQLVARQSGALWWPDARVLVVSDLHLGKSERMARRSGALLPPFAEAETLQKLRQECEALLPQSVICLGDSFDDDAASFALAEPLRAEIRALAEGREWVWVTGNHDPAPDPRLPGTRQDLWGTKLQFRHEMGESPDVSGHWHPMVAVAGKRWRAFVLEENHLILPAFGHYTGGIDFRANPPVALSSRAVAIGCAPSMFVLPLKPQTAHRARGRGR